MYIQSQIGTGSIGQPGIDYRSLPSILLTNPLEGKKELGSYDSALRGMMDPGQISNHPGIRVPNIWSTNAVYWKINDQKGKMMKWNLYFKAGQEKNKCKILCVFIWAFSLSNVQCASTLHINQSFSKMGVPTQP